MWPVNDKFTNGSLASSQALVLASSKHCMSIAGVIITFFFRHHPPNRSEMKKLIHFIPNSIGNGYGSFSKRF
jgi:sulfite exporter TauE/SafE